MPRSLNTALVTVGPMTPDLAAQIASHLTERSIAPLVLEGQRVAVVTGIDDSNRQPRHSFTGGELDMLVQIASRCWGQQNNGAPGRPIVTQAQSRLAMRAYYVINQLGQPTAEQLRQARSSDYY